MKQLKIGIIGAGLMGKTHARAIRDIARRGLMPVALEGIAGLDHAQGRALARRCGCRYFENSDELISNPDIDAVVIATPTASHLPLVESAAKAKKAIFLEKPIGRNLAEAEIISAIIRKAQIPHQIGLVLRFSPTYNALRQLLADPRNGKLIFCRFRDDQRFPIGGTYQSRWRGDVKKAGGGALLEHSIHDVDVLQWFFGEAKLTDAIILDSNWRGIEKLAALNLRLPGGASAQLASVWHENQARENERHIEIFFERRFYQTDGKFTSPIVVEEGNGRGRNITKTEIEQRWRKMIGWRDAKNADFPSTIGYEMYVFLKSVMGKAIPSAVGAEVGLKAHRLIESAYRMGKMGRRQ